MKIVHVASEVYPYSRMGGLSNVLDKLPAKQAFAGDEVMVCSPMYLVINTAYHNIEDAGDEIVVTSDNTSFIFNVYKTERMGVTNYFFFNKELFGRRGIYGDGSFDYSDNDLRFGLFSQAVLKFLSSMDTPPQIIHCHDWQTGLIPLYMKIKNLLTNSKTVFTIHDVNNQGIFNRYSLDRLDIPWKYYSIEGIEYFENISLLKSGIVYSDSVTTVSKTYAEEIITSESSCGMEGVLETHSDKFCGILNGTDYVEWNPQTDPFIEERYSTEKAFKKEINKKEIAEELEIDPEKALFSFIMEFNDNNGIVLLNELINKIATLDASFVIMGYGNHKMLKEIKKSAQSFSNITIRSSYVESLMHRLVAASDFIMNIAMYQPCGDTHFIGMRYGCIPVTLKTGGIIDSVRDISEGGIGLVAQNISSEEFFSKIKQALEIYKENTTLESLRKNVMRENHSWLKTAAEYINLYKELLGGNTE